MTMPQSRQDWVDFAKAIGIALVVYGHVARGLHNAGMFGDDSMFRVVDSIIYSFHMPLFFFLSGLFFCDSLARRGPVNLMLNKVDAILYPYVLWSLLQGSIEALLSPYTNGGISWGDVLNLATPRAQFWFLYALFFVFALCTLLYVNVPRKLVIIPVVVFGWIYIISPALPSYRIVGYLASSTVFFALGIWFNEIRGSFDRHCIWLTPVLGLLFIVGQYLFHITFDLTYESRGWAGLALATLSILFVTSLCMWMRRLKLSWLSLLGSASMSIYLMHILAGSGMRIALSKVLGIDSLVLHLVLGTSAGLLIPLVADKLIRRYRLGFMLSAPAGLTSTRLIPASR